jgi:hypothetical protein
MTDKSPGSKYNPERWANDGGDPQAAAHSAAIAKLRGLQEWVHSMAQAVPTSLMQDLVADSRAFAAGQRSKYKPDEQPVPSGPIDAHSRDVPGINLVDSIAQSFAQQDLMDEVAKRVATAMAMKPKTDE